MLSQILHSSWNTRAWTYQKAYLSTRRLVFTDRMVYFHCRAMHCLETISVPLEKLHTSDLQRFRDSLNASRVWPLRGLGKFAANLTDRIVEYSEKQLSFHSDALNAFEGILARFEVMKRPVRSFCGVPLFHSEDSALASLVVGLSWSPKTLYPRVEKAKLNRRPVFPSWSWVGWAVDDVGVDASAMPRDD